MNMNAIPAASLIGITGIARRLVLDGALEEAAAREALDKATAERKPISNYLRDNRLVTSAQMAAANSIEFGMPVFDPATMVAARFGRSVVVGLHP
jgi:type IV pilus assembly protein PilB